MIRRYFFSVFDGARRAAAAASLPSSFKFIILPIFSSPRRGAVSLSISLLRVTAARTLNITSTYLFDDDAGGRKER